MKLPDWLTRDRGSRFLNTRIDLRALQLKKQDAALDPLLERLGMQRQKRILDQRTQASLQLAYRGAFGVKFYDGGDHGVGVYDLSSNREDAAPYMTVYIHLLEHQSPHLYFDNKANNHQFRRNFPEKISQAQLVPCEGYFSDKFDLYAPPGYTLDSLVVGAPDVLDAIDRLNMGADVEILGDQLYMIFPNDVSLPDILEELVANGQALAAAVDDNLSRYRDERRVSLGQPIGYDGRRIIRK